MTAHRMLVTGACGYLGRQVVARLADPALGRHQLRFCFCKRDETLARAAEGLAKLA